jgi:N-acetyl-gamma-glutamyl-phosphate reductase
VKPHIGVAIAGGTGYGAGELLRYLVSHPAASVVSVLSSSSPGSSVEDAHPHLSGFYRELRFEASADWAKLATFSQKILFLALPHGHSARFLGEIPTAELRGLKVIDLSADFRLQERDVHEAVYEGVPFEAEARASFVYGLPELGMERVASATRIANPGCLSTACILAAAPLLLEYGSRLVGSLCFDAKTGTSGAGRAAQEQMQHSVRHANFEAYKVLCHRHEPEILQALRALSPQPLQSMFVPHLLPTARGIFVTAFAQLTDEVTADSIEAAYRKFYAASPFIRLRNGTPRLQDVAGTNFCDVALHVRGKQIVVLAALDNFGKGMAGQAIQNMNLMCDLPPELGLQQPSLGIM